MLQLSLILSQTFNKAELQRLFTDPPCVRFLRAQNIPAVPEFEQRLDEGLIGMFDINRQRHAYVCYGCGKSTTEPVAKHLGRELRNVSKPCPTKPCQWLGCPNLLRLLSLKMPTKKAPGAGFQPLSYKRAYMTLFNGNTMNPPPPPSNPYAKKPNLQYPHQVMTDNAGNAIVSSNFDTLRSHIEGYAQEAHHAIENMKNHVLTDMSYIVSMYEATHAQAHGEQGTSDMAQEQTNPSSSMHAQAQAALAQHHMSHGQDQDEQQHS